MKLRNMPKSGKPNDRARLAEAALFQWNKESIVLKTKTHCGILKWIKYGLLSVTSGDLYQI